jgi:hypothetical protein
MFSAFMKERPRRKAVRRLQPKVFVLALKGELAKPVLHVPHCLEIGVDLSEPTLLDAALIDEVHFVQAIRRVLFQKSRKE